jgi:fluoride exporter
MTPSSPLVATLYVAMGGGTGAAMRYQLGRSMTHWLGPNTVSAFPWATLSANVLGVGLLGGFTTFSSFSLEMMLLMERGQPFLAFTYAAVSLLAGLTALYIGLIAMRIAG